MKKFYVAFSALLMTSCLLFSQNVKIGIVGQPFPDFTLTTSQGIPVSVHDLKGKNILLIVPRGKYQDDKWCTICNYQYAEYTDIEMNEQVREKYNLEIIYLFPYGKEIFTEWIKDFPEEMNKIESWKNPADTIKMTDDQRGWMMFARSQFPKKFIFADQEVPLPLPVLLDENQEVSKSLDLSRTEWNGSKTLQNIPAIYIIDKDGILRFKYISQSTVDRPSTDYVFEVLNKLVM